MYFENSTSRQAFEEEFASVRQQFQQNWFVQDVLQIEVVPSFGFAYVQDVGTDYDTLYHTCDLDMYADKKSIKSAYSAIS
ncbi:MAG: hypothetical protein ABS949_08885 [Solibacillus sp.]